MAQKNITKQQKKDETDIWIILIVTMVFFGIYSAFSGVLTEYVMNDSNPVLARLALNAFFQFALAGLGITIVCIYRKKSFISFGLRKKGMAEAAVKTLLCFVPYILYVFASGSFEGYRPFSIMITDDIIKAGFPINAVGMAVIIIVWGFFEGFNYAVISSKINDAYPGKKLDTGAAVCAVVCLLFHPLSFSLWGIVEMVTVACAIYGMLRVRAKTDNAWGCVLAFCFIWNAL